MRKAGATRPAPSAYHFASGESPARGTGSEYDAGGII